MLVTPGGLGLLAALSRQENLVPPPGWQMLVVATTAVLAVAALTSIPARIGARHPVTESLQAEHA